MTPWEVFPAELAHRRQESDLGTRDREIVKAMIEHGADLRAIISVHTTDSRVQHLSAIEILVARLPAEVLGELHAMSWIYAQPAIREKLRRGRRSRLRGFLNTGSASAVTEYLQTVFFAYDKRLLVFGDEPEKRWPGQRFITTCAEKCGGDLAAASFAAASSLSGRRRAFPYVVATRMRFST